MGTLVKTNGSRGLFPTLPSFFDDFVTRDLFDWSADNRHQLNSLPAVNVQETDNSFVLEVAAPGMSKKDFTVELDNNLLKISAQKEYENSEGNQDSGYTRREFGYHNFMRSFRLPDQLVSTEKVSATYKDGILLVTVPKAEAAKKKPTKTIRIS